MRGDIWTDYLAEWKNDVAFAIAAANAQGPSVSIGGLSTGGALSVYAAYTDRRVDGAVFLFSAALDLAGFVARSQLGTNYPEAINNKRLSIGGAR